MDSSALPGPPMVRKIVYTSETSGNSNIWITDADGTNRKQLTTDSHQNTSPVVTSDGLFVVFSSDRGGTYHIWRMDVDGNNQKQLTFGEESAPCSTPDGRWVVYSGREVGQQRSGRFPSKAVIRS